MAKAKSGAVRAADDGNAGRQLVLGASEYVDHHHAVVRHGAGRARRRGRRRRRWPARRWWPARNRLRILGKTDQEITEFQTKGTINKARGRVEAAVGKLPGRDRATLG